MWGNHEQFGFDRFHIESSNIINITDRPRTCCFERERARKLQTKKKNHTQKTNRKYLSPVSGCCLIDWISVVLHTKCVFVCVCCLVKYAFICSVEFRAVSLAIYGHFSARLFRVCFFFFKCEFGFCTNLFISKGNCYSKKWSTCNIIEKTNTPCFSGENIFCLSWNVFVFRFFFFVCIASLLIARIYT